MSLHSAIRRSAMLLLFGIVFASCADAADLPDIVFKIPGDRREFQVLNTEFSKDQTAATVTFSSSFGIFAFNLDLGGRKLSKLTLVVREQTFCEGLTFRKKEGGEIDLRRTKGVKISVAGRDVVIELDPIALGVLKPGGQVQFVNQYR